MYRSKRSQAALRGWETRRLKATYKTKVNELIEKARELLIERAMGTPNQDRMIEFAKSETGTFFIGSLIATGLGSFDVGFGVHTLESMLDNLLKGIETNQVRSANAIG